MMMPDRVGPPIERPSADIKAFWCKMLRKDGYPMWSFWENIRTWCQYRDLPNMHLFHYNDLKRDLPRELRELAGFLDIPIDEARWLQIVESYTYDWMRADV